MLSQMWKDLPHHAAASAVEFIASERWNLQNRAATNFTGSRVSPAAMFEQFVRHRPPWEREILQYVDLSEHPFTVSDALSLGIRAVSDGSVWTDNQRSYR